MVRFAPLNMRPFAAQARWPLLVCALVLCAGCSRTHYRQRADRDAFAILGEKSAGTRWEPPPDYAIQPDPRSRLFDPTPIDDPLLPIPAPSLYGYELPGQISDDHPEAAPPADGSLLPPPPAPALEGAREDQSSAGIFPAAHQAPAAEPEAAGPNQPSPFRVEPLAAPGLEADAVREGGVALSNIPQSVWESIPPSCLGRMLEFGSVRGEYRRSFGTKPETAELPRLSLEQVVELARLNSREYQTQKELLYRVALRLTLERYDYELKFAPFGNGTALDYTHTRIGGITENTLRIPSAVTAQQVLATGANLIVSFANEVVLTFNGPEGFAADVGSELLFDVSQTVFQRDVIFERLTQAERNVVYAAREFARFRKEFFFDLADRYYDLLRLYRQIEIDTQSYFTLVRALRQRQAEYDVGLVPRVQVDQVEQNALAARSALIANCNDLEETLDALKLRMGLPTETPLGLDLAELEQLTANDQAAVTGELVRRAQARLQEALDGPKPDRAQVLGAAIDLISRMLTADAAGERLSDSPLGGRSLRRLQIRLQIDEARLLVRRLTAQLEADRQDPTAPPLRILQRTLDIIDAALALLRRQEQLAGLLDESPDVSSLRETHESVERQVAELRRQLEQALESLEIRRVPELARAAGEQLDITTRAVRDGDALLMLPAADETEEQALERMRADVERLLALSGELLAAATPGLRPVEIGMDEALLAALIARLDLMNERGFLADDWRQIKLAADDLKSILDLRVTQRIRTENDQNRPFDFTFDDSQTQLRATFDAPLNRRAQRNNFRERLLDYQAGRRRLMEREDTIKLDVRSDLRDLELIREQYVLGVASAALAYERVASTELQLRLEVEGITARDFLEAQTAFAQSLSVVADQHLSFLVTRAQLFLDLELLELDTNGFWPPVSDETLQPAPVFAFPPDGWPPYGHLPPGVHYSDEIERMLTVPAGEPGLWSK